MKIYFISFLISFLVDFLIILISKKSKLVVTDTLHQGPQKFHSSPTPRIGGLGIFLGLSIGILLYNLKLWPYVIISSLMFFIGFFEDISNRLSPKIRLLLMIIVALLAYFILNVKIDRAGISFLEPIISIPLISFLFTVFALIGVTNAINIIDGFNGLASGVSIMILIATAFVANEIGDILIRDLSLISIFAILGFFVLNWPFGKIFLGDGGAYFLGFWLTILVISLIERNKEVSPWFAMTVFIYPVWEVIFSIYRKKFKRGTSPFEPDPFHFHMLVYKILIKKYYKNKSNVLRNSYTSIFIWMLNLFPIIGSILFYHSTILLFVIDLLFIILYNFIYTKIIFSRLKGMK